MKTTPYFETVARINHPDVQSDWIEQVLVAPVKTELQANGRISFLANIPEFGGRALRVITEGDRKTVHNAFFDCNFFKRQQRGEEPV